MTSQHRKTNSSEDNDRLELTLQQLLKGIKQMNRLVLALTIAVCLLIGGCVQSSTNANGQTTPIKNNESGNITYGMAKKHIVIGKTSQEDVIKLFGSPDNMVMKKNKEIWIYDRFRVESSSSSSSGYGTLILLGGSTNSSNTSTYTKTITIIIDFNETGIVEDFNMRVGGY